MRRNASATEEDARARGAWRMAAAARTATPARLGRTARSSRTCPSPEKEQIEALVLEKKKKDLLAKYASEELQGQQGEAKAMLNKRA